ncbi:phosphodiesterase [Nocardiopsis sp. MG754419]|uniref:phosphodiesterase n=1 Tax=Nocardiopsis sp. MG754419 TaxID=2259865 RepID=UPI001BAAD6F2|nr:phosphodiesterase [Nocardiopsis sp. MG754419]MBR8743821.1 phosphodiesterase [Nocardiopsis sp. MG754419]
MTLSVAHLSDPHVTSGALAAEPAAGLHRALGEVLTLDPRPTCVIITGDLVDHGLPDEYAALREILDHFPLPLHLAAGNHDDRETLRDAFGGGPHLGEGRSTRYLVEHLGVTVVVLDSLVLGSPGGRLGEEQRTWLDAALRRRPDVPAVVCLHHPPVPVGIPFLDGMGLSDGAELEEVIARHPHVVRVLAGHVHRSTFTSFAHAILSTAPSTYRQSALRMNSDGPPGYVHASPGFQLHQSTGRGWVTHTVRVGHEGAPVGHY